MIAAKTVRASGSTLVSGTLSGDDETDSVSTLDTIVVVGNLTNSTVSNSTSIGTLGVRDIIDTPFSVNSYTEQLISNTNARNLTQIVARDPSISSNVNGAGFRDSFSIRGLSVDRFAILYDGIPGMTGSDGYYRTNNLSSVEVFRGINAFNQGAATAIFGGVGGTINLVPKRPSDQPVNNIFAGYESDGSAFYGGDLSRRSGEGDQFGLRINAFTQRNAGNIENFQRDQENYSLFLDWKPTDTFVLEGEISRFIDTSRGYRDDIFLNPGVSIPNVPDTSTSYSQPWAFIDQSGIRYFGRATWEFHKNWQITAGAGGVRGDDDNGFYSVFGRVQSEEGDVEFTGRRSFRPDNSTLGSTVKLDGSFQTGLIDNRISLSGTFSEWNFFGLSRSAIRSETTNIFDPVYVPLVPFGDEESEEIILQQVYTFGGNYEASILDGRVSLITGLRWVDIIQEATFLPVDYDEEDVTLMGALYAKPTEKSTVYVSYTEGLEGGQVAPLSAINANEPLPPTTATQIELGGKLEIGSAIASVAYFQIDRAQTGIDQNNVFGELGGQDFKGVEARLEGRVTENLDVIGGLTFFDVEIDSTDAAIDGNRTPGVPEFAGSIYAEYRLPFNPALTLTGGVTYEGAQFIDVTNLSNREADSWISADVGLRYDFEVSDVPATAQVFVSNVSNEEYWSVQEFGGLQLSLPRQIGVSLNVDF
ncbi:MAG: TonB-dependent receptor [Pseudomonadota bacterium]